MLGERKPGCLWPKGNIFQVLRPDENRQRIKMGAIWQLYLLSLFLPISFPDTWNFDDPFHTPYVFYLISELGSFLQYIGEGLKGYRMEMYSCLSLSYEMPVLYHIIILVNKKTKKNFLYFSGVE